MTVTDSQYAAITVIRLLELKRTQPEVFARLMRLEDHNEKREEEEEDLWSYHQQHVVTFLKKVTYRQRKTVKYSSFSRFAKWTTLSQKYCQC